MSHCCPPNAVKYLAPDYKFVGKTHTLADGVEFYATGDASTTKKAVLVLPDIFGWNGGRTRNLADWLAEEGYYTVVPKLLVPPVDGGTDGDGFATLGDFQAFFAALRERFPYDKLEPRLISVTNHIKAQGIEKIYLLGFCWGGWAGSHLLASPLADNYTSIAIGHPSIHLEEYAFGKSIQELVDRIQKPVLFLPARGDPDGYREGGSYYASVKSRFPTSQTVDFAHVDHGFIPRSDLSDPVNKEAVDKALELIRDFFAAH